MPERWADAASQVPPISTAYGARAPGRDRIVMNRVIPTNRSLATSRCANATTSSASRSAVISSTMASVPWGTRVKPYVARSSRADAANSALYSSDSGTSATRVPCNNPMPKPALVTLFHRSLEFLRWSNSKSLLTTVNVDDPSMRAKQCSAGKPKSRVTLNDVRPLIHDTAMAVRFNSAVRWAQNSTSNRSGGIVIAYRHFGVLNRTPVVVSMVISMHNEQIDSPALICATNLTMRRFPPFSCRRWTSLKIRRVLS